MHTIDILQKAELVGSLPLAHKAQHSTSISYFSDWKKAGCLIHAPARLYSLPFQHEMAQTPASPAAPYTYTENNSPTTQMESTSTIVHVYRAEDTYPSNLDPRNEDTSINRTPFEVLNAMFVYFSILNLQGKSKLATIQCRKED